MSTLDNFVAHAQQAQKRLVLPEGMDPRVVKAANMVMENNVASKVIVLGSEEEIAKACAEVGICERKFETLDYLASPLFEEFSAKFAEMRAAKGATLESARVAMQSRIYFGAMMCHCGMVDGLVAGSVASTADMLRAAFHCIGTKPGIKTGSSCFIMDLEQPTESGDTVLLFGDCAVNPNPTAEQLVDIALATSETYHALLGSKPKVAFLSFATKGSAKHELTDKVAQATEIFKNKVAEQGLDIECDGELQADAAIVPSVGASKAPGSSVAGSANVLIFPDLNAGNICYKLVQRLARANAYGPILQGLKAPLNDLSRGCSAEDIYGVAVITACQAAEA